MPASKRTGAGPGSSLGRYALTEHLGGGPTGEGFRAKVYGVAGFERQFAIKRFHDELVGVAEKKQRLSKVAHKYATVVHPHIARMHEYGVFEGQSFVVVDLVPGIDVARLIKGTAGAGNPLPPGALLGLVSQAARAVGYAHSRGVAHLGLCPTNVIASVDGDAKVTDFGFLPVRLGERPADDPTLFTRVPYMAPEQLLGQPATPATDVFSLAVVAYEILAGVPAFAGSDGAEIAALIHAGQLPPLPLPTPIVEALQKAIRPTPSERFVNADVFAKTLASAIRSARLPGTRREIAVAVKQIQSMPAQLPPSRPPGRLAVPTPSAEPAPGAEPVTERAGSEAETRVVNINEMNKAASMPMTAASPLLPPPMPGSPASPPPPPPGRTPSAEYAAHVQDDAHTEVTVQVENPLIAGEKPSPPGHVADVSSGELEIDDKEIVDDGSQPLDAFAVPATVEVDSTAATPVPKLARDPRKRLVMIAIAVVGAAVLGAGGYFAYNQFASGEASVTIDAAPTKATVATTTRNADAAVVATATQADAAEVVSIDAGDAAEADAGQQADASVLDATSDAALDATLVATNNPPAVPGKLIIKSDPRGAYVYLDGAYKGKTPLKLPATADKHKLALLRKGYKMHRAEINGNADLLIELPKVAKLRGRAKIKVRCKRKHRRRYYIIIDGQHTGLLCPDRVRVDKGVRKVEIYDAVTDSTQVHNVSVKSTHRSVRLRVEEE